MSCKICSDYYYRETECVNNHTSAASAGCGLEPCPFCGQEQDDFAGMVPEAFATCTDGTYSINCSECNCTGPAGKSMVDAVNAWNARKP